MKKYYYTFLILFIGFNCFSQQTIDDGKKILEAYISPLAYSIGASMNNGWYNTAKPHKLGGFDITITLNTVIVPESAKSFNIDESNENTFSGGQTPTILGNSAGSNVTVITNNVSSTTPMPKGLNIPIIPIPMLQAGVGLIKGTELDFRYMPEMKIGNSGNIGLYGFGVKHDILQWIPVADMLPLDLSIQAGYTKLSTAVKLIDPTNTIEEPQSNLDIAATTINLILSKKLLMFTPYISLGYNSTVTTFNVAGNYTVGNIELNANNLTNIKFESNNNLKANLGFRFNIALIALQANYTFSKYPTATVGLGISLR